jgi:GDPmannose 4,6-dehydratase
VADDFVLATGETTEIREFVRMAFDFAGIEVEFIGRGNDEKAVIKSFDSSLDLKTGKEVMAIDTKYFRPSEVDLLIGDASKARHLLGWSPRYDVRMLCKDMVESDLLIFKREQHLKHSGFQIKNEFE